MPNNAGGVSLPMSKPEAFRALRAGARAALALWLAASLALAQAGLPPLPGQDRGKGAESPSRAAAAAAILAAFARPAGAEGGHEIYSESWLAARPEASGDKQWQCLSEALYFEARGEDAAGLFAVAEVILNRVDSTAFPDTVCAVINEGTGRRFACQFTYTCDGLREDITEPEAWIRVGKVARIMLDGGPRDLTDGATYYHTNYVAPSWSRKFIRTAAIGLHYFYRKPPDPA